MASINPSYNINYLSGINFRAKAQETQSASTPISPPPNVSFKGTEALAAYNYNLVNKNSDFDIKLTGPIKIPENIQDVKGVRVYSSTGELVEIVDEDENYRYVYEPETEYEKYNFSIYDKATNKLVKSQTEWKSKFSNISDIHVTEYIDSNTIISASYNKETLEPLWFNKIIHKDKKEKHIDYTFENEKLYIYENDKANHIEKQFFYDKYGNTIEQPIIKDRSEEYINLEKPKLHPQFILDYDPKQLDGEKKYYSNGKIEQNIVNENGKKVIYYFNTKGEVKKIQKDNLTISYFIENNVLGYSINEDYGNGKHKITSYLDDGTKSCTIEDNDKALQYNLDKNDNITDFFEFFN